MLASARFQRVLLVVLVVLVAGIVAVLVTGPISGSGGTTGTVSADNSGLDSEGLQGNTLPTHLLAANFTLTNQVGRRVTLDRDRGHVVVLTFIYSHCTNDCPFMVEQIKGALDELPGDGHQVRVIGVSVQPRQDTPLARRRFLAAHEMSERMQFVDGPMPVMREVWRKYGIQAQTATAEHSAFVIVIDKAGYERVGFPAVQLTPDALAFDLRKLGGASA